MDEVQRITTGVMRLVVCDIFYYICPSKVRAYNSKGELKNCCNLLVDCFMYVGGGIKGGEIHQQELLSLSMR